MLNNLFVKQNTIGYIIKIAGVAVMIWGVIQGIFSLSMMAQMGGHFNEWGDWQHSGGMTGPALLAFFGIIATHFLYGVLIIGFGEVIDTLQKIYFRLDPKAKQQWEEEQKGEQGLPAGEVPYWVKKEVKSYYDKKQSTIQSIEKTSDAYIFRVSVDERTEYIQVGFSEPRILSDEEAAKFRE
ncbi:hypothetical protein MHZ92_04770 [Sporosarcina sp. ACRSL]|uniref:hypothetical protein n=1 Tax=Sporosarcina sp. ACRSL TaxID=2918215 RepID=UPI001EF625D1|nr:hypothetical protein [Sporosarcina sp. ACRSL]MCG7343432.1 hypothetical protein [Sporosarcina sp. ACRSL]